MGDRRATAVLFAAMTAVGLGQAILFAILPPAARDIGLSPFQVSIIFVVSATIWMFMSPYWGRRSDVLGRRPVILIGLLGFAASMLLLGATIEIGLRNALPVLVVYALLIASRCVFACFGSGAPPASQAYVADRTSLADRTSGVSMLNAAFGLGQTLGPATGAVFASLGVVALAVAGVLTQMVVVQKLRPSSRWMLNAGAAASLAGFLMFVASSAMTGYVVGLAFMGAGFGLIRPGAAAGASVAVRTEEQGEVAGMTSSVGVVGNIVGPMVGTALYELGPAAPYWLNATLMALALVFGLTNRAIRHSRA